MKVKIKDDILKAVFNTLQNITEEGIISLEKDEIYICCMDEGRVCLIEFTIKKKDIEYIQKTISPFSVFSQYHHSAPQKYIGERPVLLA